MSAKYYMKRHDFDKAVSGQPHELIAALLDFKALPGRYPLTLREPRALFECSHEVLMLASGRRVDHVPLDSLHAPGVQQAACFFVRMAMLRPGVDHYTLLGLEPGFKQETLREHYRMLMRLTHPDIPGSGSPWPPGSASRINLANDVLSSKAEKADYDGWLANSAKRLGPVNRLAAVLPCPAAPSRRSRWDWALVVGGAGMVVALAFMLSPWPGLKEGAPAAASASAAALLADAEPEAPAPQHSEVAGNSQTSSADRPQPSPPILKARTASPAPRLGSGRPLTQAATAPQPAKARAEAADKARKTVKPAIAAPAAKKKPNHPANASPVGRQPDASRVLADAGHVPAEPPLAAWQVSRPWRANEEQNHLAWANDEYRVDE